MNLRLKSLYILFLMFVVILFNCKTTPKESSIFKNFSDVNTIDFFYLDKVDYWAKEFVLGNEARVVVKQSSMPFVNISFYLKTPPLYQTRLNSGVEKIILLYIKEIFKNNITESKIDLKSDIVVEGNFDFSRFSFSVSQKNINMVLRIFLDSLIIKKWDENLINTILEKENRNFLKKYKEDDEFYINYSLEKYVFNAHPLFNSFDGNIVSLSLLNIDTIKEYYDSNFCGKRMLLFIYGDINSSFNFDFTNFSNNFKVVNFTERSYNRFVSTRFKLSPYYIEKKDKKDISILVNFYKAPSFLNDDYFTYLVTLKIFEENSKYLFSDKVVFDSMMINITNYGRIIFYSNPSKIIPQILIFRRFIDFYKEGRGFFYYYDKENDKIIKEYKNQLEDKIVYLNINNVLKRAKKDVLNEYNFNDIDSIEKEKRYISIYLLINKEIKNSIIRERIESISYEDIVSFCKNSFLNFSWALLADSETLKTISKDFFVIPK